MSLGRRRRRSEQPDPPRQRDAEPGGTEPREDTARDDTARDDTALEDTAVEDTAVEDTGAWTPSPPAEPAPRNDVVPEGQTRDAPPAVPTVHLGHQDADEVIGAGMGPAATGASSTEDPDRAHEPGPRHGPGGATAASPPDAGSTVRPAGTAAAVVGALVLALASAGVAVGAGLGAGSWPVGEQGGATGTAAVATGPATSALACPGGPVPAPVPGGTDEEFAVVETPSEARLRAVAVGAAGPLEVLGLPPAAGSTVEAAAAAPDAAAEPAGSAAVTAGGPGSGGAARVAATGGPDADAPSLAALETTLTPDGDLRGLAATSCAAPSSDSWLVGGQTGPGRSTRVVLANPGTTTATASIEVLTGVGPRQPPGAQEVVVPPGQRTELLLEGLVQEVDRVAVRVRTTGGSVAPSLVQSRLDGLVPRGVAVVGPVAAPAPVQVVSGVVTAGAGSTATLRLAVPGSSDGSSAVVTWRVLADEAGAAAAASLGSATTVPAGSVVDVPLGGLPAGAASVLVESDVAVTSAVVLERSPDGAQAPGDLAWSPATTALAPGALLALPAADSSTAGLLVLGNPADAPASVDLVGVGADGELSAPTTVAVPAGGSTSLDPASLGAVAGVRVEAVGASGVHGALVLSGAGGAPPDAVAVVPFAGAPQVASTVPVRVAPPGRWP